MHLLYTDGSGTHAISTLGSVLIILGSFLGLLVCLWALFSAGVRLGALTRRVRELELELARLAPRTPAAPE